MEFDAGDAVFIGACLQGFLYGLYSGIFTMYLQHEASKGGTDWKKNILFFLMCALYLSSLGLVVVDTAYFGTNGQILELSPHITYIQGTLSGCCDFTAQIILIYRCWVVWHRDIRVMIIPSVFAIAYLAIWIASNGAIYIAPPSDFIFTAKWGYATNIIGVAISLLVNALVTGLIVFRIFQVFCEVKPTFENKTSGTTGGRKLWSIILVLIESGMALVSIKMAQIVITIVQTNTASNAFPIIVCIHQMLNGITPTIILVRVAMGFSFHDEESLVETVGSLCFASNNPNPEIESIGSIIHPETRDGDDGLEQCNDMDVVDVER